MLRFTNGLLTGVLLLYALGALGGLLFTLLDRTDIALVEFIKTGYWLGLWTAPLVLLVALLFRRWRVSVLLFPAVLAFALYYGDYYWSPSAPDDPDAITVLSFNVLRDDGGYEAVAQIIRQADADIVGIQELGMNLAAHLERELADLYPYQALHPQDPHFRGQGVFSRYPITEDAYWQFGDLPRMAFTELVRSHGHQRVVLDVNGQAVVVYNVHPWPPLEWEGALNFRIEPAADEGHQLTVRRLIDRATNETLPTLLLGDFNMSDQFIEYDLMTQHFRDSQREAGRSPGYTYPAGGIGPFPALIRLDYIFHSSHFRAVEARTLAESARSDHFPVWAALTLPG